MPNTLMRFSWRCRVWLKCFWRVGCCSLEEIAPGTHWVLLWQEDQFYPGSPEYQAGSLGGHKQPELQYPAGGRQRPKEFYWGVCGIISTMFYFPDPCTLPGTRECHLVLTEGKVYGKPYKDSFLKIYSFIYFWLCWVNSGRWWWTVRPGVLRFMGSQRVGQDWTTELTELNWCWLLVAAWAFLHLQWVQATLWLWPVGFSLRGLLLLWARALGCVNFSGCGSWALGHKLNSCSAWI